MGLWVARASEHPFLAVLGAERVREERARIRADLVSTQITADEYIAHSEIAGGPGYDPAKLAATMRLAASASDIIVALAALNRIRANSEMLVRFTDVVLRKLPSEQAGPLGRALERNDGRRALLARAPILAAIRDSAAFARPEAERLQLIAKATGSPGVAPALPLAMKLSHLAAEVGNGDALSPAASPGPNSSLAGLPSELAMTLLCAGSSSREDSPVALIGRARLMYGEFGNTLSRHSKRATPREMVEEALGMTIEQVCDVGLRFWLTSLSPLAIQSEYLVDPGSIAAPDPLVERFLEKFSVTLDQLSSSCAGASGPFQVSTLRAAPLLRLDNGKVCILDSQFLVESFTTGLYRITQEHEHDAYGPVASKAWTRIHGELHERMVEEYLHGVAPTLLGSDRPAAMYTEEDLQEAFPGRKAVDVVVDFGASTLIADAQGGPLDDAVRDEGDADALIADLLRIVAGRKTDQLHETAMNLLSPVQPENSPAALPAEVVLPAVIPAGAFPIFTVTHRWVRQEAARRGLLTDSRIRPLMILDFRDLDALHMATAHRSKSAGEILLQWSLSDDNEVAFADWYALEFDLPGIGVSSIAEESFDECFDDMFNSEGDE